MITKFMNRLTGPIAAFIYLNVGLGLMFTINYSAIGLIMMIIAGLIFASYIWQH